MSNDTLIERIDEHIETGKSAGEWAEVNNAELVLLLTDIREALSPVLPEEVAGLVQYLRNQAHEHYEGITKMGYKGGQKKLKYWKAADLLERLAWENEMLTIEANEKGEHVSALYQRIEKMEEEIKHIAFEGGGTDTMAMRLEKLIDLDPNWIPNPEGT